MGCIRVDVGANGLPTRDPFEYWVQDPYWSHVEIPLGAHLGRCGGIWVCLHGTHVHTGCKNEEIPLGAHIEVHHGTNVGEFGKIRGHLGSPIWD